MPGAAANRRSPARAEAIFAQPPVAPVTDLDELSRTTARPPPTPAASAPPSLNLTSVHDDAVTVADEVRRRLHRRHDERDVGLGERVARLLLVSASRPCAKTIERAGAGASCSPRRSAFGRTK
jgi:hypothetical protein